MLLLLLLPASGRLDALNSTLDLVRLFVCFANGGGLAAPRMPEPSACDSATCVESEKSALSADDESGSLHLLQRVKSGGSKDISS